MGLDIVNISLRIEFDNLISTEMLNFLSLVIIFDQK